MANQTDDPIQPNSQDRLNQSGNQNRPLTIVTGASTGIGYDLAKCYAEPGFDLLVAADEPEIRTSAEVFRALGVLVDAVEADLATLEGVDQLYAAINGRPVDALLANAGRGLGKGFLDQNFDWLPGQRLFLKQDNGEQGGGQKSELQIQPVNQFASEIDHFSECVLTNRPPRTPGEMGLADMQIIAAIREAIRSGNSVRLDRRA
jgi:hypothetical protein